MEFWVWCLGILFAVAVLYCLDKIAKEQLISARNAGQKYKYETQFYLKGNQVVQLYFYSNHLYESISQVIQNGYIRKEREFYILKNQEEEILIDKRNVVLIRIQNFKNV